MSKQQVQVNGKLMRTGFTTGTAATAALYAAAYHLKTGLSLDAVEVMLPGGGRLCVAIQEVIRQGDIAIATVVKDGGDDIDATHGLVIGVKLILLQNHSELRFSGGEGVGSVTKGGLSIPIGEPAINPVPRKMMQQHFETLFGKGVGAEVEVFAPLGAEAALKTFNPKLGIVNGISILGTTGIVSPMSEEAYKHSLALELRQKMHDGVSAFVFVFGNYGKAFALTQGVKETQLITTSNFIGFMLDEALVSGVKRLIVIGNIGKLIKVAGGIFHTHSHVADGRFEILGAYLAQCRAPYALIEKVMSLNTMEEAVTVLDGSGYESVYQRLVDRAKIRAMEHVRGKILIDCVMFSEKNVLLASTLKAKEIKEAINDQCRGDGTRGKSPIDATSTAADR